MSNQRYRLLHNRYINAPTVTASLKLHTDNSARVLFGSTVSTFSRRQIIHYAKSPDDMGKMSTAPGCKMLWNMNQWHVHVTCVSDVSVHKSWHCPCDFPQSRQLLTEALQGFGALQMVPSALQRSPDQNAWLLNIIFTSLNLVAWSIAPAKGLWLA
jgi:hypothetical protein